MVEDNKKAKEEKKLSLEKIRTEYEILRKKYDLPEFDYMNENFEIESISGEESKLLAKKIRKQILEKMSYYTHALETFMNPQNAPLFVFDIIKSFTTEEQELIKQIYKKLGQFGVEAFGLEISYNEKKEAEFIKKANVVWSSIAEDLKRVYSSMKNNYTTESKKQSKSYLG